MKISIKYRIVFLFLGLVLGSFWLWTTGSYFLLFVGLFIGLASGYVIGNEAYLRKMCKERTFGMKNC